MDFDKNKSARIAQELLGMTFEMRGRGPERIDCYGVLIHYYAQFGIEMPDFTKYDDWDGKEEHYLNRYAEVATRLPDGEPPRCGDFILFRNVEGASNHAGVYLGENRFVHAYKKIGVKIDSLTQKPWKDKVSGYFRINVH